MCYHRFVITPRGSTQIIHITSKKIDLKTKELIFAISSNVVGGVGEFGELKTAKADRYISTWSNQPLA